MAAMSFRILLALDLENGTDRLLAEARRYARALDASVDVVHIAAPDPDIAGDRRALKERTALDSGREAKARHLRSEHQQVQAFGAALRQAGVRVDNILAIQGTFPEALFEQVDRSKCDLLILGSHRHGALHRFWYGDAAASAVKQMPCALLVVPI